MDYFSLLSIKPKYKFKYFLLLILLFSSIIFIGNKKCYDVLSYRGVVKNQFILIDVPILYLDTIINGNVLKIGSKKYDYKVLKVNSVTSAAESQVIFIKIDKKLLDNEVINISFFVNYEKVIEKIKRII